MKATSRPDSFEVALSLTPDAGSVWFVFDGPKLVLRADGTLPTGETPLPVVDVTPLGTLHGTSYLAGGLDGELPDGFQAVPVRSGFGRLPDHLMGLAGYAAQLIEFPLPCQAKLLQQVITVALQLPFRLLLELGVFAPQGPQHVVTRPHVVIVHLPRITLFAGGVAVVAVQDAKPRAVFVVHKVGPAIGPNAVVPLPVAIVTDDFLARLCFGVQHE